MSTPPCVGGTLFGLHHLNCRLWPSQQKRGSLKSAACVPCKLITDEIKNGMGLGFKNPPDSISRQLCKWQAAGKTQTAIKYLITALSILRLDYAKQYILVVKPITSIDYKCLHNGYFGR